MVSVPVALLSFFPVLASLVRAAPTPPEADFPRGAKADNGLKDLLKSGADPLPCGALSSVVESSQFLLEGRALLSEGVWHLSKRGDAADS